jgi:DNA-binding SARP family transcriptional activator
MHIDLVESLVAAHVERRASVLRLFGGPLVTCEGLRYEVPQGSKRLLVFVALQQRRVERRYAASSLWPDGTDGRAAGNLRSALWRLKRAGIDVLRADKYSIVLRDGVMTDVQVVLNWATRIITDHCLPGDLDALPQSLNAFELLPGWYDDWVLMERERVRQRILHAMEALSHALVRSGRCADGVEAAMVAVGADPLRETAQQALLEAHLAEGNWIEGRRGYEVYRTLLAAELRAEPDPHLRRMLCERQAYLRHSTNEPSAASQSRASA